MKKKIVFFTLMLCATPLYCETLSLQAYLNNVDNNNPQLKSINSAIEAMDNKLAELDMVYGTYFSANGVYSIDKSGSGFGSTLAADEMDVSSLNLGLSKKFNTGSMLSAGLSGSLVDFKLSSPFTLNSQSLNSFSAYDLKPFARIDQSLIKDTKGGQTALFISKTKASVKAAKYMQVFAKQQVMLLAKSMYFRVSLARDVVAFRKASLERANKLLSWTKNRFEQDLADKSDMLQAEAAQKLRGLNLQMALEEEENATKEFNELISITHIASAPDVENILLLSDRVQRNNCLIRNGFRADYLASQENLHTSEFSQKEATLRLGAELSAFGYVSAHGLDMNYSGAAQQVTNFIKPTYTIGLNYTTPIFGSLIKKTLNGYKLDVQSSSFAKEKARNSMESDWNNLCRSWKNVIARIKIAADIKDIQEKRSVEEQLKYKKGRNTTYQLLTAENDLDDAQLNLFRLFMEELMIDAQTQLYTLSN